MKKLIVSSVVALSLVAGVASAQSYYPTYTTPSTPTYSSGGCLSISSNLSVGSRGSQVLALQQFLVSQNYPGSGTWMETSYFGVATRAALIDFQQSRGLPQTGITDSATLSALNNCGGTNYTYPGYQASAYPTTYPYTNPVTYPYTNPTYPYTYGNGTPTITSLSQNTGTAGNSVTIYGQGFDPSNNIVYFGGQAVSGVSSYNGTSVSFTIPYLYSYSNNQTVQIYVTDSRGTSNSVTFTLNPSSPIVCNGSGYSYANCGCANSLAYTTSCGSCGYNYSTYPYNTGCPINTGTPVITYLNPQSGGVATSVTIYGSGFTTSNNTVHFGNGIIAQLGSSDGQSLSFAVPAQITGFGSQPIVLGTYQISVTNGNGVSSNSMPFTVTSTGNNGNTPTITSVSGPNALSTGQQGTWTMTVNTSGNSYTTIAAYWGDTGNGYVNQAAPQVVYGTQTITFTHAYVSAGTYTLTFTVSNQNGQSNTYTSSVIVSGSTNFGGTPSVNYLSPSSGYVGTQVTISGSNFSTNSGNTINFGSGAIQNVYSNGSSITFTVASYTTPYCTPGLLCGVQPTQVTPGTYNVSVMDQYGTSNALQFTVL